MDASTCFSFQGILLNRVLKFNLHHPSQGLWLNHFQFRVAVSQQLEAASPRFDQEQTKPIQLFHRHHMLALANLALCETTPSCECGKNPKINFRERKKIPLSLHSRLTPVLVPPVSNQKPDVGLKAIGIFAEALRPDCPHSLD